MMTNGSGCGCDLASERPMVRKYVVESVLYWATAYHIDGFRFDLMALEDVDTMNAIRAALDSLPGGESILLYGEPWMGGGTVTVDSSALLFVCAGAFEGLYDAVFDRVTIGADKGALRNRALLEG